MTGFEVYKMYLALRMHFTKDHYDYVKYRGKVNASEQSFEQRRDRYFFKKLATKYDGDKILNYFVANFMHDPKGYIKSFSDGNYERWKVNQESFCYKFRQDVHLLLDNFEAPYQDKFDKIFEVKEGTHPSLLRHYLSGDISLETLVDSSLAYFLTKRVIFSSISLQKANVLKIIKQTEKIIFINQM